MPPGWSLSQHKEGGEHSCHPCGRPTPAPPMTEAQIGLVTATPTIVAFAGGLRAMGVLSTVATIAAVAFSVAIALLLFATQ